MVKHFYPDEGDYIAAVHRELELAVTKCFGDYDEERNHIILPTQSQDWGDLHWILKSIEIIVIYKKNKDWVIDY